MFHFNIPKTSTNIGIDAESLSFSQLLKVTWNAVHNNTNAFRYKIGDIPERYVNEKYLLQLNPNRGTNRRAPEQFLDICQPFDETKFNFTKASKDEIMFTFRENGKDDVHTVLVNVSPISRYHSLLCVSTDKCLPQIVSKENLKLAIDLMLYAKDCDLRIGFNSLCAWASINHLHYHLFFEKNPLPVEKMKCKHLKGPLYILEDSFPAQGFCFEISNSYKIDVVFKIVEHFLKNSIAHNILITRGDTITGDSDEGIRLIIFPRKSSSGPKLYEAFNVAVCEISGWFPVYSAEDFSSLRVEDLEKELKRWQIDNFKQLCEDVTLLY